MGARPVSQGKESILIRQEIADWWVGKVMKPVEDFLILNHVPPNALTLIGLGLNVVAGLLFGLGHFFSAGWVIVLAGNFDFLDGRVARATNRTSQIGAYLDSVTDRYSDLFLFSGLIVYYRHSWVMLFALAGLFGSFLVSYTKSRAESLGVRCDVGLMQRPERILYLGLGSILSSIFQITLMPFYPRGEYPAQHILIFVLIFIAVLANVTAVHRIWHTMQQITQKEQPL